MWTITRTSVRAFRRVATRNWPGNLSPHERVNLRFDTARWFTRRSITSSTSRRTSARYMWHACVAVVPPLIVVLDLDECLVHSTDFSSSGAGRNSAAGVRQHESRPESASAESGVDSFLAEFCDLHGGTSNFLVLKRKGVDDFLAACCAAFETYVFTAGTQIYADAVLDKLDPERRLAGRFYRSDCLPVCGPHGEEYLKDLETIVKRIGRNGDTSRIVLVDNNPTSFVCQPRNGIPVSDFVGQSDEVLVKVMRLLQCLSNEHEDVRIHLHSLFDLEKQLAPIHAQFVGPDGNWNSSKLQNQGSGGGQQKSTRRRIKNSRTDAPP